MIKTLPFITGLLFCIIVMSCPATSDHPSLQNKRPNIILMMSDDQGWGDVGYLGHPHLRTPHLDQMAAEGVRFNRFYAASAVCSPTRGSVLTGRHPLRYGICYANCGHLLPEEITLAEMVQDIGYRTGHFGKWHLGTLTRTVRDANRGGRPEHYKHYAPPWEHGFDVCFSTESKVPTWDPMITPDRLAGDVSAGLEQGAYFGTAYWTRQGADGPGEKVTVNLLGDDSRVIMDRVLPFIAQSVKENVPFLSVVWFHTPHLPVLTGKGYRAMYSKFSDDQQHYYGTITAMDEQIGRLRMHLKKLGIADNTLLFFTSDNGPEGQKVEGRKQGITNGLRGRKRSLHEGGIRVPGLMVWPGHIAGGQVIDVPCYASDYFPTIAALLDINTTEYQRPYDGIDLQKVLSNPEMTRHLPFRIENQAALIGNRYKIYSKDDGHSFEMYDLVNDFSETSDVASKHPAEFQALKAQWQTWKTSQEKSAQGLDYPTIGDQ